MATLSQLASIVQNTINGGYGVINENIHINQIKDEIVMTSRRLYDEYRRNGFFSDHELNMMYQRLTCIELICRSLTECCGIDLQSEQKVLYAKIPAVIELRYVGTIEWDKSFIIKTGVMTNYVGVSRFTRNKTIAWLRGNTELIIFNPPTYNMKYIAIDAMFQDPRDLYAYDCSVCKSDEEAFPIPDKFADIITGKLIASYMQYKQIKPLQSNTQADVI
jgi:hypothetical protein